MAGMIDVQDLWRPDKIRLGIIKKPGRFSIDKNVPHLQQTQEMCLMQLRTHRN